MFVCVHGKSSHGSPLLVDCPILLPCKPSRGPPCSTSHRGTRRAWVLAQVFMFMPGPLSSCSLHVTPPRIEMDAASALQTAVRA